MSKRFPIPEFERDRYKDMAWSEPKLLTKEEQARVLERVRAGDEGAYGSYPVQADAALFERFRMTGPHRHALMCVMPARGVTLTGRSWAWEIQRAVVLDSLDPERARVLQEWTTPRPMNTRLGPDTGVPLEGGVVYVLFGHRYGDHWIANRTLAEPPAAGSKAFSVLSAAAEGNNDFHACNLSFHWA